MQVRTSLLDSLKRQIMPPQERERISLERGTTIEERGNPTTRGAENLLSIQRRQKIQTSQENLTRLQNALSLRQFLEENLQNTPRNEWGRIFQEARRKFPQEAIPQLLEENPNSFLRRLREEIQALQIKIREGSVEIQNIIATTSTNSPERAIRNLPSEKLLLSLRNLDTRRISSILSESS